VNVKYHYYIAENIKVTRQSCVFPAYTMYHWSK